MSEKEKPHSTAYLDGLRGIACLIVFSFHTLWAYCAFVEYGYGDGPMNHRFLQLPMVRLVHAGHAMVAVFFAVGGYVMALKPLRRARAHDWEDLQFALAGSVFRKGLKLYLPAVLATFVSMLTLQAGLWEYPRRFISNPRLFNYADRHPLPANGLLAGFARWLGATAGLTNIWSYYNNGPQVPYYNQYDPHLWTLPFEMRASLVVAVALLAFSRCRPSIRMALVSATIVFCVYWDRWECMLFLGGSLLAEMDMELKTRLSRRPSAASPTTRLLKSGLSYALLLPALYLLSTPNLRIKHTPGYAFLRALVPRTVTDPKRFLQGSGALLLTFVLTRCPVLQAPFSTRFAREAGRRSYALYIVHGPLTHVLGYSLTPALWTALGYTGFTMKEYVWEAEETGLRGQNARWLLGFAGGSAVLWVVVWCVAGFFEAYVERGCARLARGLEDWCFVRCVRGEEGLPR